MEYLQHFAHLQRALLLRLRLISERQLRYGSIERVFFGEVIQKISRRVASRLMAAMLLSIDLVEPLRSVTTVSRNRSRESRYMSFGDGELQEPFKESLTFLAVLGLSSGLLRLLESLGGRPFLRVNLCWAF